MIELKQMRPRRI